MNSPCSFMTPTASSSPEIELTSVGDNPNNNGDGRNDPNNNGDGRNDPNNNGDGRNDPNNGGGANVNDNGGGANDPNDNNNNNKNGADNNSNVDEDAISATKLCLKALGISVVVSAAALMWTITLNPEVFVKAVGDEHAHCYCSPDRAVQVEDLVPPSMRNPTVENSRSESRWVDPGKNPNKNWLTRIIRDEECECRSRYFYIFMVICNGCMLIIWWSLMIMTFELPHVTCPVWLTLWGVWFAYCMSTRRLYPGEGRLWLLLQLLYTALLMLFVYLRLSLAEKWKSCVWRFKKIYEDTRKSFGAWLKEKCGATEEAEAMIPLV